MRGSVAVGQKESTVENANRFAVRAVDHARCSKQESSGSRRKCQRQQSIPKTVHPEANVCSHSQKTATGAV